MSTAPSRAQVHRNLETLLSAADSVARSSPHERFLFLAPVVPSLEVRPFLDALARSGWYRADEPLQLPGTSGAREAPEEPLAGTSLGRRNGAASQGISDEDRVMDGARTSTELASALPLEENGRRNGSTVQTRLREPAETARSSTQPRHGPATSSQQDRAAECRNSTATKPVSQPAPKFADEPALSQIQTQHPEGAVPEPSAADGSGWPEPPGGPVPSIFFRKRGGDSAVLLVRGAFADCAHSADAGLAMAGTATEQMVKISGSAFSACEKDFKALGIKALHERLTNQGLAMTALGSEKLSLHLRLAVTRFPRTREVHLGPDC